MLARLVAVVALVVAGAGREVEAARNLLVKQRILHRPGDVGVHADSELADVARTLVNVELVVDALGIVRGRVYDLAVLELKADVRIGEAAFQRGRVVGDHAVDALAHGRGVDLAVRDVAGACALDGGQTLDREGKIRAGTDDMHAVGLFHERLEAVHGTIHFAVVQAAHIEIVILERLGAHVRHLRHGRGRIAKNDPLRFRHADAAVDGRPVIAHICVHVLRGDVGHFGSVAAAAHADVRLHLRHERAVDLGAELELRLVAVQQQLTIHGFVAHPKKGVAADAVHLFDERAGQILVAADGLDEDVFPFLQIAGVVHKVVRQFLDSRIKHDLVPPITIRSTWYIIPRFL